VGIPLTVGFRAFTEPSTITEPFVFSFTRWNFGYHKAFHEFFFHTMEFWLSWISSRIFPSHDGISAITKPCTNFSFTWWNLRDAWFGGKTLFIYITKSIYIGSASLKTLPLNLEPPLQGKEYGPLYYKVIVKKVNIFVPETTYRLVVWVFLCF
jgi:hypothetical protein